MRRRALRRPLPADRYAELVALYERTLLTARLHRAFAQAYVGYRVCVNDPAARAGLAHVIWDGLDEAQAVAEQIRAYDGPVPVGQWNWRETPTTRTCSGQRIANGWDKYGGIAVPRPSA